MTGRTQKLTNETAGGPQMTLRDLPSVDEAVQALADVQAPRALIVSEVRAAIAEMRAGVAAGRDPGSIESRVRGNIDRLARPSLRRVINATGVILHTNLG